MKENLGADTVYKARAGNELPFLHERSNEVIKRIQDGATRLALASREM